MDKLLYAVICLLFALLGLFAGGLTGFLRGTANLPPNAGAGEGTGVISEATLDAFWGAVVGFGVGLVCCLLWYFFVQRRTPAIISGAVLEEGEVWPPAPRMQASGAVKAPSGERPSDAE